MASFAVAAMVLGLLACAILLLPLLRAGQLNTSVVVTALSVPLLAAVLYPQLSTFRWGETPVVDTASGNRTADQDVPAVGEMVDGLQARLVKDPDDVNGWKLLARSYIVLGQYPEARAALEEVWTRTPEPDNELKLAYAEAAALTDQATLGGEAGRLVEEVLESEPMNPRGLWYGGLAARINGRPEVARERWSQLLTLNPPDEIVAVLRQQLSALGGEAPAQAASGAVGPGADSGVSIQVQVSLGDGASSEAAALFVIARDPGGGPPVAVSRHAASALPGSFTLSDANAMLAGRSLKDFDQLEVVARLSRTGEPIGQTGDWYGRARYTGDSAPLEIVINQQLE